eukprot:TRINITY_DN942_c0_g1_i4.p1 TRINITY_DN942_c0_g1~~TRINITY_DN942_c0_g1_i4.p1  ORF type:complete len:295 (-),score=20.44 TRINITY_DN942_c0_g1_i4:542-1426(-)
MENTLNTMPPIIPTFRSFEESYSVNPTHNQFTVLETHDSLTSISSTSPILTSLSFFNPNVAPVSMTGHSSTLFTTGDLQRVGQSDGMIGYPSSERTLRNSGSSTNHTTRTTQSTYNLVNVPSITSVSTFSILPQQQISRPPSFQLPPPTSRPLQPDGTVPIFAQRQLLSPLPNSTRIRHPPPPKVTSLTHNQIPQNKQYENIPTTQLGTNPTNPTRKRTVPIIDTQDNLKSPRVDGDPHIRDNMRTSSDHLQDESTRTFLQVAKSSSNSPQVDHSKTVEELYQANNKFDNLFVL